MHRFFDSTIRPLLDVIRVSTIVEVGSEAGHHTRRLLPYAKAHDSHLHVIDPEPRYEVKEFLRSCGSQGTFHQRLSHDVLPGIDAPDVVLLDGDHNWFTVIGELRILDGRDEDWPLTFLHDVEWPYGRRDMYYSPETVPAEARHPFAFSGIVEGRSDLSSHGINAVVRNAKHEGGPRNGVLTALEDFLDETDRDLALFIAPGSCGLAIVADRRHLRRRRFTKVLRKVHDPQAGAELSPQHASTAFA